MYFVYLIRIALEYHTYLLLSNNSLTVIWFVRMEGNSSYPENHRKRFFLETSCNFKRACWFFWEWGGCKKLCLFFFYLVMIILYCILLASLKCEMTMCVQWSVYDACTKVGRRQNTSSPDLLKTLVEKGTTELCRDQLWRDWGFAEHNRKGGPVAVPCLKDCANVEVFLAFLTQSQQ